MDFIDQVKQFSGRVNSLKDTLLTEEATKMSIIVPFFSMLGWDVFNPTEFIPEFTADVGIKKGEKVDYAIIVEENPVILIEAKSVNEDLDKHGSQLFRYFGTTTAKFGILTNGIIYRFFTDLESQNKMDEKPFLEINLLDIKEAQVAELKKFCKPNFDADMILGSASELKYANEFKNIFAKELQDPSDNLARFFLSDLYTGRITQTVLDRFKPVLKKSLNSYISDLMNDKIKAALRADSAEEKTKAEESNETADEQAQNQIETTTEELGAYFIIKNLLSDIVPVEDINYKDTLSYFNLLYKNNTRKWICRLILKESQKYLIIPDKNKHEQKYSIDTIYNIEQYKEQLIASLKNYMDE